jgi:hypothetical protein
MLRETAFIATKNYRIASAIGSACVSSAKRPVGLGLRKQIVEDTAAG